MRAPSRLGLIPALLVVSVALAAPAAAQAAFGIEPGTFSATASEPGGAPDLQAGSHPYEYTVSFALRKDSEGKPEGRLRNVVVSLPPGLVGNPLAVPRCTTAESEGEVTICPGNTQVGIAHIRERNAGDVTQPIYNMAPAFGAPARFGFSIAQFNTFLEPSLRSDGDFGIDVADLAPTQLSVEVVSATFWGVPADPAHDSERYCPNEEHKLESPCSSTVAPKPFLSLPTSCSAPLTTSVSVSSLAEPDVFDKASIQSPRLSGCGALSFEPSISAHPTSDAADSPTGLDFDLVQPQASTEPGGEGGEVCSHGQWSGEPSEFAYQWLRNGEPINGATGFEYKPVSADEGTVLQCEVIATNPAAAGPGHAISNSTVIPPEPATAPPTPEPPFIFIFGETAYCGAFWAPNFTYRWFKDGVLVPGQSGESLEVSPGETPLTLQCEVIGSNEGGSAAAFSETATTEVPLDPPIPNFVAPGPRIGPAPLQFPPSSADLRDVVVTLPEGVSLNPSAANGLAACSNAEIGYQPSGGAIHFSKVPQRCPGAAKVGTVEVESPLVDHKLPGAVYVAKPFANPFGTLLAIYLVIEDPQTGIVAKLAGKVEPSPSDGQLKTTFTENPQLPLSDFELHFFAGARAALKTPLPCGKYTTSSALTPWSAPEAPDAHPVSSFDTSVAAGGSGSCPATEAAAPKDFGLSAGTISPLSASYSPFVLRIARADGSQNIAGVDVTLPEGLLGKLAGVSYCPEPGIALARSREAPEGGKAEQAAPSCPASSEVGTVNVAAGAGDTPLHVPGHAYLAGAYKGAPLSLVVVVPAVAGPFDLGAVVDRVALNVGEFDARIHAVADPLPTIIDGIPLDLRSIEVKLERSGFTLNPTSCGAMAIEGQVTTKPGQTASLSNHFQAAQCNRLRFKPALKLGLSGPTKRTGHPALKAVVTYPKVGEYANIAGAQVGLPHSEFLDQGNLSLVCKRADLKAGTCPKKSIYGYARAWSPLLDKPLEGPVYLGVGFGDTLPDLVAELNGQIRVLLKGKVDTDAQQGIRNTFEAVPDAPVSRFELRLKGGKKYGLLANSENLCKKTQRASALFSAQNGKQVRMAPLIANDCGKKKGKAGAKH